MESHEEEIVSQLKKTETREGFVNLIEAARVVGSTSLREQAVKDLIKCKEIITMEESRRVGLETTYAILAALLKCECGASAGVWCVACQKWVRGVP